MMFRKIILSLLSLLSLFLLFSINSYAESFSFSIIKAEQVGIFSMGIGSVVELKTNDSKTSGPSVFLGSTIKPDKVASYLMFLNKASAKVFYIDASNFSKSNLSKQLILDPYPQAGGTCTGYAIDDFLQQTLFSGFVGNGSLLNQLATEEGRSNLLVDSINQYYLTMSHRYSIKGIMNSYGKVFGFACKSLITDSFEKAKNVILSQLKSGAPVIFSFPIGPNMAQAPFQSILLDQPNFDFDNRLWIPRKVGERNSGGHSIVAAGAFDFKNKTYLVMIDSDWSEPRIWDLDSFLNNKTAIDEVEFVFCK